jgi:uncharacterized membrane protein
MNGAHVHLMVNHGPILGAFAAAVLLAIAMLSRSRQTWTQAGLIALAVATAGAAVAFVSGDLAADVIAGMPRSSNKALEEHHLRSTVATTLLAIAAVLGLVIYVRARKRGGAFGRGSVALLLVATIAASAAFAWTGLAGGRVNHP